MPRQLAHTALLVDDCDSAMAYFTQILRFVLLPDTPLSAPLSSPLSSQLTPGKRWVRGAPSYEGGALLARASHAEQRALIGRQSAGRVGLFLHTDNLDADMAYMHAQGVHFLETPRSEAYGRVVMFEDRWGNRWSKRWGNRRDMIEPHGGMA